MAKAKFSKSMLQRGLERFESVDSVALWLGVHRTTVWRKMRAWNLDMQQVKADFATREEGAPPVAAPAVPESLHVAVCPVILGNGQPCPKPMPHRHAIGPNNFALPQRPQFNIAMSYGPKLKPWEPH